MDHDHETLAVRMILCNNCNNGLGRFFEDIELLQRAAEYIAHFKEGGTARQLLAQRV